MRTAWVYVLYALVLVAALGLGLASTSAPPEYAVPSIYNPTPPGVEVLKTYLEEGGRRIEVWRELPQLVNPELRTWVIIAPTGKEYSQAEVELINGFVAEGGRLVYLAARAPRSQTHLDKWLQVKMNSSSLPLPNIPDIADVAGTELAITVPAGPLQGLKTLRVSQQPIVSCESDDALAVTRPPALWFRAIGKGEVWVGSGADLAENKRLDLADNLTFWDRIASDGPLAFDESHLIAPEPSTSGRNVFAFGGQLLLVGLVWAYARGKRMAPARPAQRDHHRSTYEYIASMAQLLRRARVENALLRELGLSTKRCLSEALGVTSALPLDELAREFELRTAEPASAVTAFFEFVEANREGADADTYLKASCQATALEAAALGKHRPH
jgi:hypothetical protein